MKLLVAIILTFCIQCHLFSHGSSSSVSEAVADPVITDQSEISLDSNANETVKQNDQNQEWNCIANGRACELLVQRRICCSGNPCQVVPSQILQLFTLGGWGVCH